MPNLSSVEVSAGRSRRPRRTGPWKLRGPERIWPRSGTWRPARTG